MGDAPVILLLGRLRVVVRSPGAAGTSCGGRLACSWALLRGFRWWRSLLKLTILAGLLYNFHNADDPRLLAVGVVEERLVAYVHSSQVIPG